MITQNMSTEDVFVAAIKANGQGINESIPMTRRKVCLSKKQLENDSEIAKELIYLADVRGDLRALVAAFYENRNRLSHPRYWELLRTVWISAGAPENYALFRKLFSSSRPFRYFVMSPEEESFLSSLPEEITVWRAARHGEYINFTGTSHEVWTKTTAALITRNPVLVKNPGLSWTLNEKFASDYAEKHDRVLIERRVEKKDVFAYFNRRAESEILIL